MRNRHANRYPGCRCDLPSATYQFSFAPYADWPQFYSYAEDIKKYFKIFAEKFHIVSHIRLRRKVTAAVYDAASGAWDVTVQNLETLQMRTETYDIFAPATGVLSNVNRPFIPGLESFTKTPVLHTAEWPHCAEKSISAVIGVGCSGLQTIGTIAPHCKTLDVYARTKFWIIPPVGAVDTLKEQEERTLFIERPETLYKHLKEISSSINTLYGSWSPSRLLNQRKLAKPTSPDFLRRDSVGQMCRRATPGAAFFEALKLPNVTFINDPIKKITPNGIVTEKGVERPVDRLILATGFDTSFKPRYRLRGKDGIDLRDAWSQRPKAYLSIAVAGFPNMFFIGCGPGITYANGPFLTCVEAQADYVVACLSKLQKQDLKSMEVDRDVQEEYNIQQESLMKDLIWSDPCASWYKGGKVDGEPDALYAGSTLQFMETLASPRWEDWKFVPLYQNRFSFLGNGESSIEASGGDRAYYITMEDAKNALKASDYKAD
ncbi:FAD/NAD(P)-binding domain-containing protein [Guyanagaster necrorhizus]|uniref:FAD/NAD(P)-binding domain-containing protein n=1 Tax=Guyanagaster necrorhizus TaxID=856835 RepID=A0A9P8AT67_9AGAR|nr:FAD/NAD(P)-binding domain-containing protein [Guyanagaster necrorhizus MCA 3950]KAG7447094.1 FAD/NAD(P)-binding domain-containing protein [Guyanagaster necrorhizus MCA 3950]